MKGITMSQFKLANTTRSAIADAVSLDVASGHKWLKVTDSLQADGIKAHMITTENKGGKPEIRDAVRDAIVLGFTKPEQALLAKDAKSLDDSEKANKRYLSQTIGKYLVRIEQYLNKAEAKAKGEVVKPATTVWSRAQDSLSKLIDTIQNSEGVADLQVADAIRTAKALKGYMPKV